MEAPSYAASGGAQEPDQDSGYVDNGEPVELFHIMK